MHCLTHFPAWLFRRRESGGDRCSWIGFICAACWGCWAPASLVSLARDTGSPACPVVPWVWPPSFHHLLGCSAHTSCFVSRNALHAEGHGGRGDPRGEVTRGSCSLSLGTPQSHGRRGGRLEGGGETEFRGEGTPASNQEAFRGDPKKPSKGPSSPRS